MRILCIFLMVLSIFKGYSIPILDLELSRFFSLNKEYFVLRYMDMPTNYEATVLDCSVPGVETYEWEILAKSGSPYAGSVQVGNPKVQDIFKTWIISITDYEYAWDSLLVKCKAKISNRPIVTLVWIIMKLKSSTEAPYHPTICSFETANCFSKMYNCMNGKGESYRGTTNITQSGRSCIPWNANLIMKESLTNTNYFNEIKDVYLADIGARLEREKESWANHNYCRNLNNFNSPSCYNVNGILEACSIPPCSDCMFGLGGGYYADQVDAPLYYGKSVTTVSETTNSNGEKVFQQCYTGQSAWWSQNQCSLNSNVNGRKKINFSPSCLVTDPLRKPPFPEDSLWDGFIWARCVSTQCNIRQVWFALVDLDGFIHLEENNKDYIEVPFEIGRDRDIYFYHFGTIFCSSFTLVGDTRTTSFASLIKIVCKNSPEKSSLQLKNPIKEYTGGYTLNYLFTDGNPSIDVVTFSLNFQLVIKRTISIALNEILYCPGYSTYAEANVVGTNNINPDLIQWLFTNDNITWYDVNINAESFAMSATGLLMKISKITKVTTLKVKAAVLSGDIESTQTIKFLDVPYLLQDTNTVEGSIGNDIKLNVKHKSSAVIKWIFGYQLLQMNKIYSFAKNSFDTQNSISSLQIVNLDKSLEGSYTAEATDNKCSSSINFFLTVLS